MLIRVSNAGRSRTLTYYDFLNPEAQKVIINDAEKTGDIIEKSLSSNTIVYDVPANSSAAYMLGLVDNFLDAKGAEAVVWLNKTPDITKAVENGKTHVDVNEPEKLISYLITDFNIRNLLEIKENPKATILVTSDRYDEAKRLAEENLKKIKYSKRFYRSYCPIRKIYVVWMKEVD